MFFKVSYYAFLATPQYVAALVALISHSHLPASKQQVGIKHHNPVSRLTTTWKLVSKIKGWVTILLVVWFPTESEYKKLKDRLWSLGNRKNNENCKTYPKNNENCNQVLKYEIASN